MGSAALMTSRRPAAAHGSGVAAPAQVKRAAFVFRGRRGGRAGHRALTQQWWLVLVGVACILAAWYYTGGASPYGYRGLGEVSVFVFFGLVATVGTEYIQTERLSWLGLLVASGVGSLACALLVVNNLRDIPTDAASGKRTLAVRLGDRRTRGLYVVLLAASLAVVIVAAVGWTPWALVTLVAFIPVAPPIGTVVSGASGLALIAVLQSTGVIHLLYGLSFGVGLALA